MFKSLDPNSSFKKSEHMLRHVFLYLFDIVLDKTELKDAVCILEKTPFSNNMIEKLLSNNVDMKLQFNNDIYSQYLCKFSDEINVVKNTFIYPANEKHLNKYETQAIYLVTETPDIYNKITLPFIEEQAVHLQVKYNPNFYLIIQLNTLKYFIKIESCILLK